MNRGLALSLSITVKYVAKFLVALATTVLGGVVGLAILINMLLADHRLAG
jgi:hypothetical protein